MGKEKYIDTKIIKSIAMHEILIVFIGLLFVFLMTNLGAGSIFFIKNMRSGRLGSFILGGSVGIMLATAVFALLVPSVEKVTRLNEMLMVASGFIAGCVVLMIMDVFTRKRCLKANTSSGIMMAMTLHNIPEGMTVGLAFSLYAKNPENKSLLYAAAILAIGIGIQNFPESLALALTLYKNGMSKKRSFVMAALSGAVEPVFGFLAVFMYHIIESVLPFFLSYAAGTMLHIIVEELIPELQSEKKKHSATIGIMTGILVMLVLEIIQQI